MKKRLAIEKKLDLNHPEFKVQIGSVNKDEPKAVYLLISSWMNSSIQLDDNFIKKLNKKLYSFIYKQSDDLVFNPERNILLIDYSMADNNTHNGKHFFNIDLTMYQRSLNHPLPWNDYNLQLSMEFYAELIIEELKKIDYLNFSVNRKSEMEQTNI